MFGFGKKANLEGLRIALLTTDGVEHAELTNPWKALRKAGAEVYIIGPKVGAFQTIRKTLRGDQIPIDGSVDEVQVKAFDALLLPASTLTYDRLKVERKVIDFVRAFMRTSQPIAAIGAAPALLALAGEVSGRRLTSSLPVREHLERAGALWVDEPVVVDDNFLTAQGPKQVKAFTKKLAPHFAAAYV